MSEITERWEGGECSTDFLQQPTLLPESYTDKLVRLFEAHPHVPFDGLHLARIAGAYAWRTRTAEARKRLASRGNLVNTQTRRGDGSTLSTYTFIPGGAR